MHQANKTSTKNGSRALTMTVVLSILTACSDPVEHTQQAILASVNEEDHESLRLMIPEHYPGQLEEFNTTLRAEFGKIKFTGYSAGEMLNAPTATYLTGLGLPAGNPLSEFKVRGTTGAQGQIRFFDCGESKGVCAVTVDKFEK